MLAHLHSRHALLWWLLAVVVGSIVIIWGTPARGIVADPPRRTSVGSDPRSPDFVRESAPMF